MLPPQLREGIEREIASVRAHDLARAAQEISAAYRERAFKSPPLTTAAHRAAYLAVRMPATYAACAHVFAQVRRRLSLVRSVIDVGAGPGTASWAAVDAFSGIERITCIERDPELIAIGTRLALASDSSALRDAEWRKADIFALERLEAHDLAVISYALGEMRKEDAIDLVRKAWAQCQSIVIIEPGTPPGFERVLAARDMLLASGAHAIAPCPHELACPMAAAGDWCHFAARLERTSLHRRLKGGELGHEDEKISYFAAAKQPVTLPDARIVRHPLKHSGHVQLLLCTQGRLDKMTITRSQKELYRRARKADWGDEL